MLDEAQEQSLLEALYNEETNLAQAIHRMKMAQTEYDLASSRYAAVRDLAKARLGASPYSKAIQDKYPVNVTPRAHEFRFIGMNPAEAAVEVLLEAGPVHVSLDELVQKLEEGGLDMPGMARLVNAGLLNRGGVGKDTLSRYYFDPESLKER